MNERPEASDLSGQNAAMTAPGNAAAAAPAGTPKIAIRGLSKAFGPKVVLDGIDLDIEAGESMLVIGGSGSGKSVLLKCILGLLHPRSEEHTSELQSLMRISYAV